MVSLQRSLFLLIFAIVMLFFCALMAYADSIPPMVSITNPASGTTFTTAQTVPILATAADNIGIAKVEFYDGMTFQGATTTSPYAYGWAVTSANNGTHSWTAKAYDTSCNAATSSAVSLIVNISTDTIAPSVPTGLTATAASCSQINLSWTASTDTGGSGLKGYNVYKGGVLLRQVTTTSTSDTGLTASSAYTYTVSAVDNANNESGQSTAASATTLSCTGGGTFLWDAVFGGAGSSTAVNPNAIAVDKSGNVIVTGSLQGAANFGSTPLTSIGSADIFVAKYTSTGALLWAQRFGGTGTDTGWGVAVDNSDNVLLTGDFQGSVSFGATTISSSGGSDIFIAALSSTGTVQWVHGFGGTGSPTNADRGYGIKADAANNVVVTGYFNGTINFGAGPLMTAGAADTFVAKFSSAGSLLWAKRGGGASSDIGRGLTIDNGGDIIVTGYFKGSADFGGGMLTSAGDNDLFVAKYAGTDGRYLWAQRFGGTWDDRGASVTTDSGGNIIATGYFADTIDFGGGPLPNTGGGSDIFLVKFSALGGHLWSRGFGGGTVYGDAASGVVIDGGGNLILTGAINGTIDFGGGPLTTAGVSNPFIAKFTGAGTHLWSKQFPSSYDDTCTGVAVDGNGAVSVTGYFPGTIDFGGGTRSNLGGAFSPDGFLVQLAP